MLLDPFLCFSGHVKFPVFCTVPPVLFPTTIGACDGALVLCAFVRHLYIVFDQYLMWLGVGMPVQVVERASEVRWKSEL